MVISSYQKSEESMILNTEKSRVIYKMLNLLIVTLHRYFNFDLREWHESVTEEVQAGC